MNIALVWILIFVVVFVLLRFSKRGLRIPNPRVGILDLTSGLSDSIIEEDRTVLKDLFGSCEESKDVVPKCDILFLYSELGDGGTLQGTERYFRATIRDSGAKIVVLASENPNPKPTGKAVLRSRESSDHTETEWPKVPSIHP